MSEVNLLKFDDIKVIIISGGVGVLPTDTVYGLVASALNKQSVARLYALKNRENKPGTIIASNTKQLSDMGVAKEYIDAVSYLWPNPISIVIPVGDDLNYLHQGVGSLAFRVTADKNLADLINYTGPLLTSSANDPGMPVSSTIDEAKNYFGDKCDFYIDGGDLSDNLPSTIVKLVDGKVEVLRQGAIDPSKLFK